MAWTTPAAATTGATLTKSWLDTYVKDNMVDVGQPSLGNAVLTSSVTWISVGSEDYSYTLLLNSLTLSKNTSLSGGVITGVVVQQGGWGYTGPSVAFTDPDGGGGGASGSGTVAPAPESADGGEAWAGANGGDANGGGSEGSQGGGAGGVEGGT